MLVQKLISVLESIERLPVYLYESPGAFHGLQVNMLFNYYLIKFYIYSQLFSFFRYYQGAYDFV